MNQSYLSRAIRVPIRCEDSSGNDVTAVTASLLDVYFAFETDTVFDNLTPTTEFTLEELSKGQYFLIINKTLNVKAENYQIVVEPDSSCSNLCVENRYSGHVVALVDVYMKSTGSDSAGDGTYVKPYQSLAQCKTHINSRAGFTIHCLDTPSNVAGNKDQDFAYPVKIMGHGFSWSAVTPVTYNIGITTVAKNVEVYGLKSIKIHFDPDAENIICKNCQDITIPTNAFPTNSLFEDIRIAAAVTGAGTNFGKGTTLRRVRFNGNVTVSVGWTNGAIVEDCIIIGDFNLGNAERVQFKNLSVTGNLTAPNNAAFQGQCVFRNVSVEGNATIDGKKYVFLDGIIRGALTLNSNSIDCIFWKTRIKGTITDSGTTNEFLNEGDFKANVSALATEANATANKAAVIAEVDANEAKIDIIDTVVDAVKAKTDNLPADPASETNVDANETKIDAVKVDTAAIKAKTDNLPADPASETNVDANETKIDAVKVDTAAIKAKTDNLPADPASVTNQTSIEAKVDTIDTVVDFLKACQTNEKRIEKRSGVHYLVIYDSGGFAGGNEIVLCPLKDFDGNNIADLTGTDTPSQRLGSVA